MAIGTPAQAGVQIPTPDWTPACAGVLEERHGNTTTACSGSKLA